LDDLILADTDEICAAIKDVFEDNRAILEPAGALGVAGAKKYINENNIKNKNIMIIASGANMNFNRLRHVAERAELGEKKEIIFSVTIPEKPGSFKAFCRLLGEVNITEFNYRYHSSNEARVFIGIELSSKEDKDKIFSSLNKNKFEFQDLSNSEVAKLHIRHMVGGKNETIKDEKLFRFSFPEKPGALMHFLNSMDESWNISLFHYRSHGSDMGRILVGIQVSKEDQESFSKFLNNLGYQFWEETDSPACSLFL
ncbi:UNVERIFIED_CONTAM: hypothetical protein GTU68_014700, partial [Idotea baltica]|nr:hypothetical protein [Idotea baltica]